MRDSTGRSSAGARWRRAAVRPLLRAYAAEPAIEAVVLSGSTARGDADRWSDVEIGVFWSMPPDDETRRRLAAAGGAQDSRLFPYEEREEAWCDDLYLGATAPEGLLIEVVHTLRSSVDGLLDAVLLEHCPDPWALNAVQGLVDGIAIDGRELVAGWKSRAERYPRGLAVAVIESAGVIDHFWRWEMLVARDNPMLLAAMLSSVGQRLLDILLALNRRYGPKPKHLDAFATGLEIAPPHLADRLRHVFADNPSAGARGLAGLVEEAFDLIETELPEVDIERLRRIFRHHRAPLDRLPGAPDPA